MGHQSGRTPDHCRRCLLPLGHLLLLWSSPLGTQCIPWIERTGWPRIWFLVLSLSCCSLVPWSLLNLRCTLERFLPSLGYFRRRARNQWGTHDRFRLQRTGWPCISSRSPQLLRWCLRRFCKVSLQDTQCRPGEKRCSRRSWRGTQRRRSRHRLGYLLQAFPILRGTECRRHWSFQRRCGPMHIMCMWCCHPRLGHQLPSRSWPSMQRRHSK